MLSSVVGCTVCAVKYLCTCLFKFIYMQQSSYKQSLSYITWLAWILCNDRKTNGENRVIRVHPLGTTILSLSFISMHPTAAEIVQVDRATARRCRPSVLKNNHPVVLRMGGNCAGQWTDCNPTTDVQINLHKAAQWERRRKLILSPSGPHGIIIQLRY